MYSITSTGKRKKSYNQIDWCRKIISQTPTPIHDKNYANKQKIKGNFLNLINDLQNLQNNPLIATLNDEKLDTFTPKTKYFQGNFVLSPFLFNTTLEILASAVRQKQINTWMNEWMNERTKRYRDWRERYKIVFVHR